VVFQWEESQQEPWNICKVKFLGIEGLVLLLSLWKGLEGKKGRKSR